MMELKKVKLWEEIYNTNKKLDVEFNERYDFPENKIFQKNCIEFLVELGEFINETKCFKYWSIKKPNKEDVLEEFADCITMILYFANILNMNIDFSKSIYYYDSKDILEVLNYLYIKGTQLMNECSNELVNEIFNNLIYVSKLLHLEEDEIIESINKKQCKIKERLNSNY